MIIEFTKMHGLGNDFVVIDAITQNITLSSEQIKKIADRNFGVGCDQLLLVEKTDNTDADFRYRIYNADGGEVEQCGNGARCFALFVRQQGLTDKELIKVETANGLIDLIIDGDLVTVDMGVPNFEPASLPFLAENRAESYDLMINQQVYAIGAVSVGNPHAVTLVDDINNIDIDTVGRAIESHVMFPNRVNAGFMQIINRKEIRLRVFERGVGETNACGTGACAAVAVGRQRDLLDEDVTVQLHGGALNISWCGEGSALFMKGPATTVFQGTINCE